MQPVSGGATLSSYFRHCGVSKKSKRAALSPGLLPRGVIDRLWLRQSLKLSIEDDVLQKRNKSIASFAAIYINIERYGGESGERCLSMIVFNNALVVLPSLSLGDGAWLFLVEHVSIFRRARPTPTSYIFLRWGGWEWVFWSALCGKVPAFCLQKRRVGENMKLTYALANVCKKNLHGAEIWILF
jgi:hypothetical protein